MPFRTLEIYNKNKVKWHKSPWIVDIGLFYSMVKWVILLCIKNYNYQNNYTQSSKKIYVIVNRPTYPWSQVKRLNDQEAI
jgi:hypothetical protein